MSIIELIQKAGEANVQVQPICFISSINETEQG